MAIRELPSEVVDQIAAGEVVERPAHLVKELVENSVDAGATEIEIEFDHGGKFVRVTDDGCGISSADLLIALNRHATSKIQTADDIWQLSSFGFRGEALASISSVCRLTLKSRQPESNSAYQIKSEFGKRSEVEQVGGDVGTTVQIEDLFANVPARLKFLKSDGAEGTQIKNVLRALSLANPGVSFRVRNKGQLLFYWPCIEDENIDQAYVKRAEQVLEQEKLFLGEAEFMGLRARVALSAPNQTTKTRKNIWTFVQNRWVQDRGLQAAVMDAYRSLLMHGEYPVCAVWLDCPADSIDVNIHPTKSQVKFLNASNAFRVVLRAARGTLEKAPWIPELFDASGAASSIEVPRSQGEEWKPMEFSGTEFSQSQFKQKVAMEDYSAGAPTQRAVEDYSRNSMSPATEGGFDQFVNPASLNDFNEAPVAANDTKAAGHWSSLQVLGQANLTYILTQSRNALVLVDQHAAHERVAFEKLMHGWKTGQIDIQSFLIPLTVDLEVEQVEAIVNEREEIAKLGIEVDQAGPKSISVRAAPSLVNETSLFAVMKKIGEELVDRGGSFALEKHISDICATLACHSVIRAGQALSLEEMQSLLVQMDEFPLSSFCPHGRPVYIEYPFYKLEKDFGRIV